MRKFNLDTAASMVATRIQTSPHPERLMKTLCRKCGPRPPSSNGMRKAQEFLRREWAAFGATNVHTETLA